MNHCSVTSNVFILFKCCSTAGNSCDPAMSYLPLLLILSMAVGTAFSAACPSMWMAYKRNCYRPFGWKMTWQSAENYCRRFRSSNSRRIGHLASIHGSAENYAIKLYMMHVYGSAKVPYWIGLRESTRCNKYYSWSDNSRYNYRGWLSGEPNNPKRERCVEMTNKKGRMGWNDAKCNLRRGFICKISK